MYRVPGEPGQPGRVSPPGFGPDIDRQAIAEWLGVNLAVLKAPDWREQRVGQRFSDSAADTSTGTTPEPAVTKPVFVTMRYTLADGAVVDVSTRRLYNTATTAVNHMWATVVDYQYLCAHAAGVRWAGNLPPADVQTRLDLHRPPATTGTRPVRVDGAEVQWEQIADTSLGTGEDIVACGGRVGQSFVAVVGPRRVLEDFAVETTLTP